MSKVSLEQSISRYLAWVSMAVLILIPFQAFFTTWLGSNFGHLDGWRIWKDVVVFAMVPPIVWLLVKDKRLRQWLAHDWLARAALLYTFLYIVLGVWALHQGRVNASALIYSLLSNLRFLGFFLVTLVITAYTPFLRRHWKYIVLIPAGVVVIFGLAQRFILPYDFLKHFGYGPNTIPAYQTVDQKLAYRRIQSTLRGANPLGAYLVLVMVALLTIKKKTQRYASFMLGGLALFLTYSRSAWLGLAATLVIYLFCIIKSPKMRQKLLLAGLISLCLGLLGLISFRHNRTFENTVFHTDNTSRSAESSNTGRASALEAGARDVIHEPLGRGPGTAGPASNRNNHAARIAENYYLQIGQEIGIVGIILFLGMVYLTGRKLWQNRADELSLLLFASLIGLSIINLLSHAWTDDTLGLLWWGLAGVALAPAIIRPIRKDYMPNPTRPSVRKK